MSNFLFLFDLKNSSCTARIFMLRTQTKNIYVTYIDQEYM